MKRLSLFLDLGLQLNVKKSTITLIQSLQIYRDITGFFSSQGLPTYGQDSDIIKPCQNYSWEPPDFSQKLSWSHGSLHVCDRTCRVTPLLFPWVAQISLLTEQRQPRQACVSSPVGEPLPRLVEGSSECGARIPFLKLIMITVAIDASLLEWEAYLDAFTVECKCSTQETTLHINLLVLRVDRNACLHCLPFLRHRSVWVMTDNVACMFHISWQRGVWSSSLCAQAIRLWNWCIKHCIGIWTMYLPGRQNFMANAFSSYFPKTTNGSWISRCWSTFFRFGDFQKWTSLQHLWTKKCHLFCLGEGDGEEVGRNCVGDTFLLPWTGELFYTPPPNVFDPQSGDKIGQARTRIILIAPTWLREARFPYLFHLDLCPSTHLPITPQLLSQDAGWLLHPTLSISHLKAWLLYGSRG